MKRFSLNHGWALREASLDFGKEIAAYIAAQREGWYTELSLPCDVHMPLITAGVIRDPSLADYSFESEWIEQRSWWFKKSFNRADLAPDCDVYELVLESLDVHADVFLNGAHLGHQSSAFYPFTRDVTGYLREGQNELLIRLTSGLESVTDADLAEIDRKVGTEAGNDCPDRGDRRRAFVRKPAYVYGWDWCPRVGTCAIAKDAAIHCHKATAVRHVSVQTLEAGSTARLAVEAEIELLSFTTTCDADVHLRITQAGVVCAELTQRDVLLCAGLNYVHFEPVVKHAKLWWPAGMGEQPLYRMEVTVLCNGFESAYTPFNFGIRTVTLDTSRTDTHRRAFALSVNGRPMFCKGGNWIPADSIYARVTREKYDTLVHEAREAGFNMLRIWGGGIYEHDDFYDACDRYGILLWHDMMFGCSAYPDHREDFRALVMRELDYQTKRLSSRACLGLFCGNNENHWLIGPPAHESRFRLDRQHGLYIGNNMMPELVRKNCPWVPYWNSSPFGGSDPNDNRVGDVHHWGACMMNPDMALRIDPAEYDKVSARFVSEYGYPGPCVDESIRQYFDSAPVDRQSRVWKLHNNTFEKLTVAAGIKKHYTDRELDLQEYLLYAGMTQSLMLGYSLESIRFKTFCGGALFWMYNDCWGEVGWTIVDYYLRRKIAFYGVRRAFAPKKLILRVDRGTVSVLGANDTENDLPLRLGCGWISFDGTSRLLHTVERVLPARSRTLLYTFDASSFDLSRGVCCAIPEDGTEPGILRAGDLRSLCLCEPRLSPPSFRDDGEDLLLTLHAETFCHGVHAAGDGDTRMSDNYFDLLPGETRTVRIFGAAGKRFPVDTVRVDPMNNL